MKVVTAFKGFFSIFYGIEKPFLMHQRRRVR